MRRLRRQCSHRAAPGGNFHLVQCPFAQIQRILEINNISTITRELSETAHESLVIGGLQTPHNAQEPAP